jgi:hypothetical protein
VSRLWLEGADVVVHCRNNAKLLFRVKIAARQKKKEGRNVRFDR